MYEIYNEKRFAKSFIRCIICFMNENYIICSAIQATISLNLLLLRRLAQ